MNAESERHQQFARHLKNGGYIRSGKILQAFEKVDRRDFLPARLKDQAFRDYAIAVKFGGEENECVSSCSQPSLTAMMLEELDILPGLSVLDIGTGTGYTSALLCAALGNDADVCSIDIDPELTESAAGRLNAYGLKPRLFAGDALQPWPFATAFDRILVGAGVPFIPAHWTDHLRPGAVIVLPYYWGGIDYLMKLRYIAPGQLEGRCRLFTVFTGLRKTRDAQSALPLNTGEGSLTLYDFFRPEQPPDKKKFNAQAPFRIVYPRLSFPSQRSLQGFHLYTLAREPFIHGGLQLAYSHSGRYGFSGYALYALDENDPAVALIPFESPGSSGMGESDSALAGKLENLYNDWIQAGKPCVGDFCVRFIFHAPDYRATHPEGWHIVKSGNRLHISISIT